MRIAASLLAVSALLLPFASHAQPNCNNACTVTIIVPAGCGSGIHVSPDPVVVGKGQTANITWNVVTEGWTFDAKGIDFLQWDDYSGPAFENKPASGSGKTYKIKNVNKKAGVYKYDINLLGPDKKPCKLDPTVVNW